MATNGPRKRLTPKQIIAVRRLYAAGYPIATLARSFGISYPAALNICHYRTHKRIRDLLDLPELPTPPVDTDGPQAPTTNFKVRVKDVGR